MTKLKKSVICHVDRVYATVAVASASCMKLNWRSAQQTEDVPGYPQEDIITLRNIGLTVSQTKAKKGQ